MRMRVSTIANVSMETKTLTVICDIVDEKPSQNAAADLWRGLFKSPEQLVCIESRGT
jgi:hypothetical protein